VLLTLIAAQFYPFLESIRFPSGSATLANGGREEAFYLRLPEDRLGTARSATTAAFPRPAFAANGDGKIVAELFRIRDSESRVIGLASRLRGTVAAKEGVAANVVDWVLLFPSRGALLMSQGSAPAEELPSLSSDRMGFTAANSGRIVKGTEEFAELTGFYMEHTEVEHIDDAGVVHGLVTLTTRLRGLGK
jgi:hypothetical protein